MHMGIFSYSFHQLICNGLECYWMKVDKKINVCDQQTVIMKSKNSKSRCFKEFQSIARKCLKISASVLRLINAKSIGHETLLISTFLVPLNCLTKWKVNNQQVLTFVRRVINDNLPQWPSHDQIISCYNCQICLPFLSFRSMPIVPPV